MVHYYNRPVKGLEGLYEATAHVREHEEVEILLLNILQQSPIYLGSECDMDLLASPSQCLGQDRCRCNTIRVIMRNKTYHSLC